jgi:hypothetical protein
VSVVSPNGRSGIGDYKGNGHSKTPLQHYHEARVSAIAVVAAIVGVTLWLGISLAFLLPSIAMGALLGAMKQIRFVRRLSDNPVFTAFLGAEWKRSRPDETVIDIAAALVVGWAVGTGISWAAAPSNVGPAWFAVVLGGGGAGGDGDLFGSLIAWILFLLFCALIGFLVSLITERVVIEAAAKAGQIAAAPAAAKATQAVVEDATTAAVSGQRIRFTEPLIKGALHGAIVGIAVALLERFK